MDENNCAENRTNFFDLHCDTITECCSRKKELSDNDFQVSIRKGKSLDKWSQVFAIWMPDELRGQDAVNYFDKNYNYFISQIYKNAMDIKQCSNFLDIKDCTERKKNAAILAIEGGSAAAGSLERLDYFDEIGVKVITLTWNGSNELGHGSRSGCDNGLTSFGKAFIRKMESKKIIVDVSHLNEKGFFDVAETIGVPFIASHSNCAQICSHERNLTDEQLKVIISRNGLCGINFYDCFLSENKNNGKEAVYRHIYHILELGGEKSISFGSDFDGCSINKEIDSLDKMPALYDYLLERGLDIKTVKDIFFDNAYRFFRRNI